MWIECVTYVSQHRPSPPTAIQNPTEQLDSEGIAGEDWNEKAGQPLVDIGEFVLPKLTLIDSDEALSEMGDIVEQVKATVETLCTEYRAKLKKAVVLGNRREKKHSDR